MSPTYTDRRFPQNAFHLSCVQEMRLTHQISCVQEMFLKCHLSCALIFSFMPPNLVKGNVLEKSCVLATGNLPEILPYTVPGNVKKMSKFPGVGNVHTMNRKCELCCRFHGISWPRKFRISSSVTQNKKSIQKSEIKLEIRNQLGNQKSTWKSEIKA